MATKFKRTLELDADGGLHVDEQRELVFVNGPAGVSQELKTRLHTRRGEDPFNPEFGLRIFRITGAPDEVVIREIRDALLRDDRVDQVDDVEIDRTTGDPRVIDVDIQVTLVDGTPLQITTGVA